MRISVVGATGSGKTNLARQVSKSLSVPHIELDGIYHQPGWTPLPVPEFRARVSEKAAGPEWVIDGNYSDVRDLVWGAADAVIVLDYPRSIVMNRVVRRSLVRAATRRQLWNGNQESFKFLLSKDPEKNIIRWASAAIDTLHERYLTAMKDPRWTGLTFVRLTHPRQAAAFLSALGD